MKKTCLLTVALLVLSVSLSLCTFAAINYPPKDTDIIAGVYITEKQPATDGEISDGEYVRINVPKTSLSYVLGSDSDWKRVKDTEFEAYGAIYDGTFYFALSVPIDGDYYVTECEPKYMWAQTALLASFAKIGTQGRNALEIGIRPDGAYHVWQTYCGIEYSPENNFAAVYGDGTATYEIAVPLSAFGAENYTEFLFCFSVSVGDYFSGGRQAYVQFGKGISGFSNPSDADAGKNAALFPKVKILREGEEPPETKAPDDPGSPETGINGKPWILICTAAAVCSVFSAAIINKKLKVKN